MKDFEIEYNKWISTKLESLTRKYSTNSTYYHTINHINDCLECLTIPELREYDTLVDKIEFGLTIQIIDVTFIICLKH